MNASPRISNLAPVLITILTCLLLVFLKWDALDLPHYWDEAFPYSYAIGYMTEHGPSIRSDAAPAIYTTGHPLLFYFLQASWNSVVGESLHWQRLFPLLLSVLSLMMTFLLGKKMFNAWIGAGAAVLLVCQNVFIAQSSFQLPEVLLTLLLLLTIYFLHQQRKWLFVISASLMLFTKEPAVVVLFIIFIYDMMILQASKKYSERLISMWIYVIPVAINALFYLDQYLIQGWILFPRHTGFMTFTWEFFSDQLARYFSYLFIYYGRNAMFFTATGLGIFLLIKKGKNGLTSKVFQNAVLLIMIIAGYLLFSAFNFYSNRYILCLFPLFCLLTSAVIFYTFKIFPLVHSAGVAVIASVLLFFSLTKLTDSDHSLGYASAVRTQRDAVEFLVKKEWQEKPIAAGFLMSKNLSSHYPRYVEKDGVFKKVNALPAEESDILVLCSNDSENRHLRKSGNFELVQRFEEEQAWCEVYSRKN